MVYNGATVIYTGMYCVPYLTIDTVGGTIPPRDAPIPSVIASSLAECVIAGVVSSIGILSAIFFLVFNLCYNQNP